MPTLSSGEQYSYRRKIFSAFLCLGPGQNALRPCLLSSSLLIARYAGDLNEPNRKATFRTVRMPPILPDLSLPFFRA